MNAHQNAAGRVALGALAAAAVIVATMISVPVPGYRVYFNFGEAVIYTVALVSGRRYGALSAAVGASLADLLLGYPLWAPFTFFIKGFEGFVAGSLAHRGIFVATGCAAIVMIAGYTSLAALLYGLPAAPVEFATDVIQTAIGILAARVIVPIVRNRIPGIVREEASCRKSAGS
jgi:uncharacterized membrane protein